MEFAFHRTGAETLKTIHRKKACCRRHWQTVKYIYPNGAGCLQKAGPFQPTIPPKRNV
jgi:hypothetical protein